MDTPAANTPRQQPAEAPPGLRQRASDILNLSFDRFMLLIGFGGVLQAIRSPMRSAGQLVRSCFDKFIGILGFGDVLKACRQPQNKAKHILASIFNKSADMAGRRAFVGTVKLATIAALAGMSGISIYMTMGAVALASGAASAVFTFWKSYLGDSIFARKGFRLFTADRLKESGKAFAAGAAGGAIAGAVGGWIARIPVVHTLLGGLKSVFNGAVTPPVTPVTGIAPPMVKGL